MRKIIVLGALGHLGVYTVDYLTEKLDGQKYEIVATGRRDSSFFDSRNVKYVRLDITRKSDFDKLPKTDVYAVVHLAGALPAYLRKDDPEQYFQVNTVGMLNVLEYCRAVGVNRIVYAHSWADQMGYLPEKEVLSPALPRNPIFTGDHAIYSISKCAAVDLAEHYHQEYGISNFILRCPNIYMYHPNAEYIKDGVLQTSPYRRLIAQACAGDDIEVWGDPQSGKDFPYVKDFCQLLYKALLSNRDGGTYNVGTGVKTSLADQVKMIIDVFCDPKKKSNIVYRPEMPNGFDYVMDISAARRELGYEPEFGFREYLEDFKAEMKSDRFAGIDGL